LTLIDEGLKKQAISIRLIIIRFNLKANQLITEQFLCSLLHAVFLLYESKDRYATCSYRRIQVSLTRKALPVHTPHTSSASESEGSALSTA
jgi:hypothetical protein